MSRQFLATFVKKKRYYVMLLYSVSVWKNILYGQKVQVFKVGHSDMVGQYTWYPTRNRIGIRKRTEKKS